MSQARRGVYCMTIPIELRFRAQPVKRATQIPISPRSPRVIISNLFAMLAKSSANKSIEDPTPSAQKPLSLLFVDKLTNDCIVIGNERRLDILCFNIIKEEYYIDTRLVGHIIPPFDGKFMRIQRKKCLILLANSRTLALYSVDLKRDIINHPFTYDFELPIVGLEVLNERTIFIFHQTELSVISIESGKIQKKQRLPYQKPSEDLRVLCIPHIVDKYVNIFFYKPQQLEAGGMFSLFKAQAYHENEEIKVSPVVEVYCIDSLYFKTMQIFTFDKDTFLINLLTQVLVIKKHYPIDAGQLRHRSENSRLVYLQNRNLLHICDDRVEAHTLEVNKNSISIKSFDCIKLLKPQNSKFMSAIDLEGDKFILMYIHENNKNPREIKYWLTTTIESSVKTKLRELLAEKKQLRDIQDVAEKMGLMKKDIFLELWCQAPKKNKEQFEILMETEDYHTIISQIKNHLRKQSMSFRELDRIQRYCFGILEKAIAKNPTEANLRRYIKSHFMIRKYQVIKTVQGGRRLSIQNSNQQESKYMVGIQQFINIRKRNIRTYIVELMKRRDEREKKELDEYIKGFRFILRFIFPQFLRQIITQLKGDFLELLKVYPKLLPKPNENGRYSGIWEDLNDWDKHIYYEKVQTVDNVEVLNEMMKKDWFGWDFLIKHDFIRLKKHEFQKTFHENRQGKIFYVLFDLLFSIIKDRSVLKAIVEYIEQAQFPVPEHLIGKLFLYWQLHTYFCKPEVLPGYKLKFQELLQRKQDDIYQLVFSNEKNSKRFILTEIKEIYGRSTDIRNSNGQVVQKLNMFEKSILTYFQSEYSSLADLKYLLNRVNNQKIQFHQENQKLYQVLVQSVFHKLRFNGAVPIPIKDILVYFQSIPLNDEELKKLSLIEKLEKHVSIFYEVELNMNLKQFFDNGQEVFEKLAKPYIELMVPAKEKENGIEFMEVLSLMLQVKNQLFKGYSDVKVLEVVISLTLNYEQLIAELQRLVYEEKILAQYGIRDPQPYLEQIVNEKIDKAYNMPNGDFKFHQHFINSLLSLLPKNTDAKLAQKAQLQLGLHLSILRKPPKPPVIISSRFIEQLLADQDIQTVKRLDIDKIHLYMSTMGSEEPKSSLYEILILKFLDAGQWHDAIHYVRLWNNTSNSNVYSALLIMKLGDELAKDLRENLVDIIIIYMHDNQKLVSLAEALVEIDVGAERRKLITQTLFQKDFQMKDYVDNPIFCEEFRKLIVENSEQAFEKMRQFYFQLRRNDIEFQSSQIYYIYYRLLTCRPTLAHELHQKYDQCIDLKRIYYMLLRMAINPPSDPIFNSKQVFFFAYRSFVMLFSSNYLSQLIDSQEFFRKNYNQISSEYQPLLQELEEFLKEKLQIQNLKMIKRFKRRYLECVSEGQKIEELERLSMQVESDDEASRLDDFKTKPFNKFQLKSKKAIIPPMKINAQSMLRYDELSSGGESTYFKTNFVKQQSVNLRMTASIRRKPSQREDKNYFRNTMRLLQTNKIISTFNQPSERNRNSESEGESLMTPLPQVNSKSDFRLVKRHSSGQSYENQFQKDSVSLKQLLNNEMMNLFPEELQIHSNAKQKTETFSDRLHMPEEPVQGEMKKTKSGRSRECLHDSPVRDLEIILQSPVSSMIMVNADDKIKEQNEKVRRGLEEMARDVNQNSMEREEDAPAPTAPDFNIVRIQRKTEEEKPKSPKAEGLVGIIKNPLERKRQEPQKRMIKKLVIRTQQDEAQSPAVLQDIPPEVTPPVSISSPSNQVYTLPKSVSMSPTNFARDTANIQQQVRQTVKSITSKSKASQEQFKQRSVQHSMLSQSQRFVFEIEQPQEESKTPQMSERANHLANLIIQSQNFQQFQTELGADKDNVQLLKNVIQIIFDLSTFKLFLETVDRIKLISMKMQSIIKPQNVRVLKNAYKSDLNFDLKLLYTPQILYLQSKGALDIDSQNKVIFQNLKERIKNTISQTNVFVVSKLMSLSFNFNKSFEYRVQYYYLESLIQHYLSGRVEDIKMHLQKIQVLLARLPINITAQRFTKMMSRFQYEDNKLMAELLNLFIGVVQKKRQGAEGVKYPTEITNLEQELKDRLEKCQYS